MVPFLVIIVRAKPPGLGLSILLAKKGTHVQQVHEETELNDQPRAAYHGLPTIYGLFCAAGLDYHWANWVDFYTHLRRQPAASIQRDLRVAKVGQERNKAGIVVEVSTDLHRAETDYVVDCDLASSIVHRQFFGPE